MPILELSLGGQKRTMETDTDKIYRRGYSLAKEMINRFKDKEAAKAVFRSQAQKVNSDQDEFFMKGFLAALTEKI